MENAQQFLTIINGVGLSEKFTLLNPTSIGRSEHNHVRLIDQKVSRTHARIEQVESTWHIVDQQSSNGTRVNGLPIENTALVHGDHISIGNTIFRFEDHSQTQKPKDHYSHQVKLHDSTEFVDDIVDSVPVSDDFSSLLRSNEPEAMKLQGALKDLTVFYRAAIISNQAENIEQMVTQVLDYLFEWIGADRGCIFLYDKNSEQLNPVSSRVSEGIGSQESLHISRTILNYAISTNNGILTNNASDDSRFDAAHSVVHYGIDSAICTPMKGRYGVIGCIYFDQLDSTIKKPDVVPFTNNHLRFLVAIANQVAIAIEDTRFYHDLVVDERLKAMGEAVGRVAHELRNVLHGIHANFSNLHAFAQDTNDTWAIGCCDHVERRVERLSTIVKDMLAFIKTAQPAQVNIDLCQCISDVVNDAQVIAQERGCQLQLRRVIDDGTIVGHRDSITQVVENLIINAFDACHQSENALVIVELSRVNDGSGYEVAVIDNGPGVPEALHEAVFDAFFTTKDVGIGLGLSNARKIVDEHGGRIELKNNQPNGARFNVFLPIHPGATWSEYQ